MCFPWLLCASEFSGKISGHEINRSKSIHVLNMRQTTQHSYKSILWQKFAQYVRMFVSAQPRQPWIIKGINTFKIHVNFLLNT